MGRSSRTTRPPSFDVAKYALDSEKSLRTAKRSSDEPSEDSTPSEVRLVTRPAIGPVMTNEGWARSMVGTPRVTMDVNQLKRLPLNHRAGYVLSLMDGTIDLDTLIEISGMDRHQVLDLVRNLYESGVVAFRLGPVG